MCVCTNAAYRNAVAMDWYFIDSYAVRLKTYTEMYGGIFSCGLFAPVCAIFAVAV